MVTVILFALTASSALVLGAAAGVRWDLSKEITAWLMAFAAGALITAVAFELFLESYDHGGALHSGGAFICGAVVFIAVDWWLERHARRRQQRGLAVGLALLAGVTLDGVPENLALGISLIDGPAVALLVAIFLSNLPEAVVGARRMDEAGISGGRIVGIWSVAALLLAVMMVVGYAFFDDLSEQHLSWPLGFAAGAVLASLADTLMPEAYDDGGPLIALATALGFLTSFLISAA